jgi:hypothetical protein
MPHLLINMLHCREYSRGGTAVPCLAILASKPLCIQGSIKTGSIKHGCMCDTVNCGEDTSCNVNSPDTANAKTAPAQLYTHFYSFRNVEFW